MPTNRKRIKRAPRDRITAEAVEIFRRMEALYASDDDTAMDEFWDLNVQLHMALGYGTTRPIECPVYESPEWECPYDPSHKAGVAEWNTRRERYPELFELYEALSAAARGE